MARQPTQAKRPLEIRVLTVVARRAKTVYAVPLPAAFVHGADDNPPVAFVHPLRNGGRMATRLRRWLANPQNLCHGAGRNELQ